MPLDPNTAQTELVKFSRAARPTAIEVRQFFNSTMGIRLPEDGYEQDFAPIIGKAFRELGILRRPLFMRAIQGKLGAVVVNKALESAVRTPFHVGWYRLPFRAPRAEAVLDDVRGRILIDLFRATRQYDHPPLFFAEWAGYIDADGYWARNEVLLAAAIDAGDRAVLETLIQTVQGKHPTAAISRTAIRALLRCEKPEAWAAVEGLLLAAQREEGLRQVILESADELHPEAFPRFLRLIIEHNLLRFTSVARTMMVWLSDLWQEGDAKRAAQLLGRLLEFLQTPSLAADENDPTDVYLRLWAYAFNDAVMALDRASLVLRHPDPAVRRAAVRIIGTLRLTTAVPVLLTVLEDSDRTVVSLAMERLSANGDEGLIEAGAAPAIRKVAEGWPKKEEGLAERGWVWDFALRTTPRHEVDAFVPFLHELTAIGRYWMAQRLKDVPDARRRRDMALALFADNSADVRRTALEMLESQPLGPHEAPAIEDLLRRKASDLRTGALKLLARQPSEHAVASGARLLASKDKSQRHGGLELLVELVEGKVESARPHVLGYAESRPALDEVEESLLARIRTDDAGPKPSLENGFGLYTPEELTYVARPGKTGVPVFSKAAADVVQSLDDLLHAHRDEEISYPKWGHLPESDEMETTTIGDINQWFRFNLVPGVPYEVAVARFPLAHLLDEWTAVRPKGDVDGQELIRAYLMLAVKGREPNMRTDDSTSLQRWLPTAPRHRFAIQSMLLWLHKRHEADLRASALLDMIAERVATSADDKYVEMPGSWAYSERSWRTEPVLAALLDLYVQRVRQYPEAVTTADDARAYALFRYIDEPCGLAGRKEVIRLTEEKMTDRHWGVYSHHDAQEGKALKVPHRRTCPAILLDRAYAAGACTRADVMEQFAFYNVDQHEWNLTRATRRGQVSPELTEVAEAYVARLVEVEAQRGELPTAASPILRQARSGIYLPQVRLLLGANAALSARTAGTTSRTAVFNDLFSISKPRPEETPEVAAAAFVADKIRPERLLELAMLAPQWASAVEIALGWDGLADAVWWVHAHTKDDQWRIEQEIKDIWKGELSERTPLSSESLLQGAVDVAWFNRFRPKIDGKRWKQIESVAKFASGGSGHARAKLFGQAMTGDVTAQELEARIEDKRNGDAVRALGLVPLDSEAEVKRRYGVIQEFLRGARQFGSARQASEKLAATIALENLARTAGYPDPLRLTWAMEAKEVEDLGGEGKAIDVGEIQVRLFFDGLGDPHVMATKNGVLLKDVPAAAKKLPEVKELVERRKALRQQAQRMRSALEVAMQRGDAFQASEVEKLMAHPGLAPMLRNLVFVGASGAAGFLDEQGNLEGEKDRLTIAHPHDLLTRGDWPQWQHAVMTEERVQPFKQAFRELYVLTETEREAHRSTRYAGHQLNPRQALAILGKRGWLLRPDEGLSKTLHGSGLTARLSFEENFFSPADIEGLTLAALEFTPAGSWQATPLAEVPPKDFSETMRDLDLIVSVASMLGIDPEASESTVEMRASVVRELALLMRLGNITLTPNHAIIRGKLAEYTVHLGSGVVHQRARGELVILAVRQPQRGRLFLPFMDDDPRTAEIVSKTLLLARDNEIKDPTILSQIVSG
jgi:HEAT repeat protein